MANCYYVDIPTAELVGDPDSAWQHLYTFPTKEEAVAFVREHIGSCDDEGRVSLVSEGDDGEPGPGEIVSELSEAPGWTSVDTSTD